MMASLFKRNNGTYVLQPYINGRRVTITFGKVSARTAHEMRDHIIKLIEAFEFGTTPDPGAVRWSINTTKSIREKLIDLKLVRPNDAGLATNAAGELVTMPATVHALCEYFASHIKPGAKATATFRSHTYRNLRQHFGDRRLDTITPGCANEFRRWLETEANERISEKDRKAGVKKGLSPVTASRRCQLARDVFQMAVDKRWIEGNPFAGMSDWVKTNDDRQFFVNENVSRQILDSFTRDDFRLIWVMLRYLGLRPAELTLLRWDWILWDTSRIKVFDVKRQRFPKYRWRYPPIFPEIRPELDAAWDNADDGAVFVVPYLQSKTIQGFTSGLNKVLTKLEIELWPRRLQNIRATRSTEIKRRFGSDTESAWIGHSKEESARAYQMVLESDYEKALQNAQQSDQSPRPNDQRAAN